MEYPRIKSTCGVVLAGGKSRRMGVDKPFVRLGGQKLIERVTGVLSSVFSEVMIVVDDPEKADHYKILPFPVIHDLVQNKGPLGGIDAALDAAQGKPIFVTAADMPFLNAQVIRAMVDISVEKYDLVVPHLSGRLHPLHAYYSYDSRSVIAEHLEANRLALHLLKNDLRCYFFDETQFRKHDPDLLSIININTPEALLEAQEGFNREKQ